MIVLYTQTDKIYTVRLNQLHYSNIQRRQLPFEIVPAKREVAYTTEQISDL
jgi:hypothetical protein